MCKEPKIHRIDGCKVMCVLEVTITQGDGKPEGNDPVREVKQYWTMEGEFLAQRDKWKEECEKMPPRKLPGREA